MNESPAISMFHYREGKRAALAHRVKEATTVSPATQYLESLTASGVSLTNFTLINAQKKDALVASLRDVAVETDSDCTECGEECQCGGVGPDGIYEVRKGKVRRVNGTH